MRQFFYFFFIFFVLCVALTGSFSGLLLSYCAIIGFLAAFITVVVFKVHVKIDISLCKLFVFGAEVLKSIYISTFTTLYVFIRSGFNLSAVTQKVPLKTKGGLHRLLICQAITLTPGTVSIKSKSGSVTVLKFKTDNLDSVKNFDKKMRVKV